MANFKIHLDLDENLTVNSKKLFKEPVNPGKRCILGQLQNNLPITECIINKGKTLGITNEEIFKPSSVTFSSHSSLIKESEKAKEHVHFALKIDALPDNLGKACYKKEYLNQFSSFIKSSTTKQHLCVSRSEDDLNCKQYHNAIFNYMKKQEKQFQPKPNYMRRQPDITYLMRAILIDWLVEVGEEYKLHNETLFRAVSYIDRFLSSMAVTRAKLQLLGITALFIAAKFEEVYPPEAYELVYMTDHTYTSKQFFRMERLILKVLCFDLNSPTPFAFLLYISSKANIPDDVLYLAMYICELTLLEADPYLDFCASLISCGAIALAQQCFGYIEIWPNSLVEITGYTLSQLGPVISHLNETHMKSFLSSQTKAIQQKYRSAKYINSSEVPFKRIVLGKLLTSL